MLQKYTTNAKYKKLYSKVKYIPIREFSKKKVKLNNSNNN